MAIRRKRSTPSKKRAAKKKIKQLGKKVAAESAGVASASVGAAIGISKTKDFVKKAPPRVDLKRPK